MDILTLCPLSSLAGDARWAWVLQTTAGVQSAETELAAVPRQAAGTRVRLLLPGDWVAHTEVKISAKSPRLIAQALPFALEETLAEEIEQVRIAHGARAADGTVAARVVNRARLEALLAALKAQGIEPDAIFSELDAIPPPHEGWVLLPLADAGLVLARSAAGEAMCIETAWLSAILGTEAQTVHVVDVAAHTLDLPVTCRITREPATQGAWVWLHQHLREAAGIDFLAGQGRGRAWGETLRPWAVPAGLAASVLLLQLALMLFQTHQLNQQCILMQAEIERVAREAVPDVKRWVNPLVQLRQMAKGAGGATATQADFLPLLAVVSPALTAQPTIQVGSLHYQAGDGTTSGAKAAKRVANHAAILDVQLTAAEAASLDALHGALKQQKGVSTELTGLRAEGGRAEAHLRIKEIGG
jgi:general secretion pathway protein L